jgi:hypothetical protein
VASDILKFIAVKQDSWRSIFDDRGYLGLCQSPIERYECRPDLAARKLNFEDVSGILAKDRNAIAAADAASLTQKSPEPGTPRFHLPIRKAPIRINVGHRGPIGRACRVICNPVGREHGHD